MLRINKYGISYFEISPVPGVLGGPVTGNIRIPKSVQANNGFELELQCIHQYTTRSGKNSTKHKDVLWDAHEHVGTVYNYGTEVVVPVSFHAPYNMPATSALGGSNGNYWQLNVKAKAQGMDYYAVFDVALLWTFLTLLFISVRLIVNKGERNVCIEKRFAVFCIRNRVSVSMSWNVLSLRAECNPAPPFIIGSRLI